MLNLVSELIGEDMQRLYRATSYTIRQLAFYLPKAALLTFLTFINISSIYSQEIKYTISLSDQDILDTSLAFKSRSSLEMVKLFQKNMPAPQTSAKFRDEIINALPPKYHELRIKDAKLDEKVKQILEPVLSLYNRENIYELFIIKSPTPLIFSDSGVVLGLTTGVFMEIDNNDELLGNIAHEIGHEYFAKYSIYAKFLLKQIAINQNEIPLSKRLVELLSIIELECDIFAALTLNYLNYSPTSFIDAVERFHKRFPQQSIGYHPPGFLREKAINNVLGIKENQKSNLSKDMKDLKAYINLNYLS